MITGTNALRRAVLLTAFFVAPIPAFAQPVPADSGKVTAADIRFMSGMIGHHAQAIEMAKLAPTHDASPELKILCGRVINAQQDEIRLMQQWLKDHGQPIPDPAEELAHMAAMPDMAMPGMLTPEQMDQLKAAKGDEFDLLFLKFMIQHHTGATSMVKDLFNSPGAANDDTVFKLASDINVDQTTEIARMRKMLTSLLIGKEGQ